MTEPEVVRHARQVMAAVKHGYAKTPHSRPDWLQDARYTGAIRELCKQAIYARWNTTKDAATLRQVYDHVSQCIAESKTLGSWPWRIPGKRTIDRRTNETADPRHWPTGIPPCLCLTAGLYAPNPYLFSDDTRRELEALAR